MKFVQEKESQHEIFKSFFFTAKYDARIANETRATCLFSETMKN